MYRVNPASGNGALRPSCLTKRGRRCRGMTVRWLRLYKILCRFKVLLWESILLLLPPTTYKAYQVAILLHAHFAIYAPLTEPAFVCHTPYTIGDGNIV